MRREVEGISQKMLTQTLRDLERHGLIERISYGEIPPRVEYRLTRLGRSLSDLIKEIEQWVGLTIRVCSTRSVHSMRGRAPEHRNPLTSLALHLMRSSNTGGAT